jgi:hypothetical protein
MRMIVDLDRVREGWAVDELLDGYVSWREECRQVWLAYERLSVCDRRDRRVAHAAYLAALDREEHAARTYGHRVKRVSRCGIENNRVQGNDNEY